MTNSKAVYAVGEAEAKLGELYTSREQALNEGNASEFNRIDGEIRTVVAVMHAEFKCGLREQVFLSFPA